MMISPDICPDMKPDIFFFARTFRPQGPGHLPGQKTLPVRGVLSGSMEPGHFWDVRPC